MLAFGFVEPVLATSHGGPAEPTVARVARLRALAPLRVDAERLRPTSSYRRVRRGWPPIRRSHARPGMGRPEPEPAVRNHEVDLGMGRPATAARRLVGCRRATAAGHSSAGGDSDGVPFGASSRRRRARASPTADARASMGDIDRSHRPVVELPTHHENPDQLGRSGTPGPAESGPFTARAADSSRSSRRSRRPPTLSRASRASCPPAPRRAPRRGFGRAGAWRRPA